MKQIREIYNLWWSQSITAKVLLLLILAMLVFLVFVFPYTTGYSFTRSTIANQMATLYTWQDGEWMFGYFVVPLILVLAILKFDEIREIPIKGSYLGIATLAISFLFYWAGYKTNNRYFGFIALQLMVMGLIHAYLGWKMFWQLKWLWLLLLMVWPLIFMIDVLSNPLQLIVTKITAAFLNLIGVDTVQNGTALLSAATESQEQGEAFSLEVAVQCSGVRSLFALILIGLSYSYMVMKTDLKRLALVACILPLVIFGNFIRLNLLLIGVALFGAQFAIGKTAHDPSGYHICAGLVVYIFVLMGLLFLGRWISGDLKLKKRSKTVSRSV